MRGSNITHNEHGPDDVIPVITLTVDWLVETQKFGLPYEEPVLRVISKKPNLNYRMTFYKPHFGHHEGNITLFRGPERVEMNTGGKLKETVEYLQREVESS